MNMKDEISEFAIDNVSLRKPTRPLRILHVCETTKGGIGSYLNVFSAFVPTGLRSSVITPAQHTEQLNERFDLIRFDRSGRGLGPLVRMMTQYVRAMRTEKPDLVFFHSTFALLALVWMRMCFDRRPTIYCSHGWAVCRYAEGSLKYRLVRMMEGTICGLADVVVNISRADFEMARAFNYRGRHILLENAVVEVAPGARDDLFGDDEAINLLFVGRLDRQKGIDILMQGFAKAREKRDDLRLHIVGSAVNEDTQAIDISLASSHFGWISKEEIDDYYRSADALIVPSRWEGFGLVVPEALRNGTPALVSDAGALPDLVEPGKSGFVFEAHEEALAALLLALDAAQLKTMRAESRQRYLSRFTEERFRDEFLAILEELLETDTSGYSPALARRPESAEASPVRHGRPPFKTTTAASKGRARQFGKEQDGDPVRG